jgi:transcriptional regulator with XRE-family HTH domain
MKLITARQLAKLSRKQVAAKAGMRPSTYAAIENGQIRKTSWDNCLRIAQALGVDPVEIFPVPQIPQEANQ